MTKITIFNSIKKRMALRRITAENAEIEALLIDEPPCAACQAIHLVAVMENNPNAALHMHVICTHAITLGSRAVTQKFEQAGNEMIAAASAKASEQPPDCPGCENCAPCEPGKPSKDSDDRAYGESAYG